MISSNTMIMINSMTMRILTGLDMYMSLSLSSAKVVGAAVVASIAAEGSTGLAAVTGLAGDASTRDFSASHSPQYLHLMAAAWIVSPQF